MLSFKSNRLLQAYLAVRIVAKVESKGTAIRLWFDVLRLLCRDEMSREPTMWKVVWASFGF